MVRTLALLLLVPLSAHAEAWTLSGTSLGYERCAIIGHAQTWTRACEGQTFQVDAKPVRVVSVSHRCIDFEQAGSGGQRCLVGAPSRDMRGAIYACAYLERCDLDAMPITKNGRHVAWSVRFLGGAGINVDDAVYSVDGRRTRDMTASVFWQSMHAAQRIEVFRHGRIFSVELPPSLVF